MASKSTNKTGSTGGTRPRKTAGSDGPSTAKPRSTSRKSSAGTSASTSRQKSSNSNRKSSTVLRYELKLLALIGFTVLSGFSLHTQAAGVIGSMIKGFYLGLFSAAGYVGPYFLFVLVFFIINPNLKPLRFRYLFATTVLFISISLLVSTFNYETFMSALKGKGLELYGFNSMTYGYAEGLLLRGGGLLGNLMGGTLIRFTGVAGAYLVALVMLAVSLMAGTDLTLEKIFKDTKSAADSAAGKTKDKFTEMDAAYRAKREEALLLEDDVLAEEDHRRSSGQEYNRGISWFGGGLFKGRSMSSYDSDNFIPPDENADLSPLVAKDHAKGYDMYEDEKPGSEGVSSSSSQGILEPQTDNIIHSDQTAPMVQTVQDGFEGQSPAKMPEPITGRTLLYAGKLGSDVLSDVERGLLADAVLASKMSGAVAEVPTELTSSVKNDISEREIAFAGNILDDQGASEAEGQAEEDPWRNKLKEMKAWSSSRQVPEIPLVEADVNPLDDLDLELDGELDGNVDLESTLDTIPISTAPMGDDLTSAEAPLPTSRTGRVGIVPSAGPVKPFTGKQVELEELDEVELDYEISQNEVKAKKAEYILPSFDLLDEPKPQKGTDKKELFAKAQVLEETLKSFGVDAKVIQITRGPSITMFELQPSPGVKVSKIVGLSDDIALALAASQVRIIAPIPGKSAVGVEIPNDDTTLVSIREVLESESFDNTSSKLSFVLGKDIQGESIVGDLSKMPHLLIAGSTGSGKSVCVNTFIASILFNATPDEVKFLMIDPKVVELSIYNGIPHLLLPVVTDPKKASVALNWAVQEMTRRYKLFADSAVRDVNSYNDKVSATGEEKLPKIVLIIDELADLMMVAPNQIEDSICRLAQMARAAGIHLLVATQRPSVDVITGLIKANIPSRIAFAVSSMTDSRTILDMGGAEKLLGKGDMLYYPVGMNKPQRIQGAFVSDAEVNRIVHYVSNQDHQPEYNSEILESTVSNDSASEADELLPDAIEMAVRNGQASASMMQRKFRIGYNRAARIVDQMEERGIIGPSMGSKPREVLLSESEWEELEF